MSGGGRRRQYGQPGPYTKALARVCVVELKELARKALSGRNINNCTLILSLLVSFARKPESIYEACFSFSQRQGRQWPRC